MTSLLRKQEYNVIHQHVYQKMVISTIVLPYTTAKTFMQDSITLIILHSIGTFISVFHLKETHAF